MSEGEREKKHKLFIFITILIKRKINSLDSLLFLIFMLKFSS